MKIDCCKLAEMLFDYVSGDLPDDELTLLEEHLRRCPPCLVYVETYRVTIRLTRRLPQVAMPQELIERLRSVLAKECPGQMGEPGA